jgi:pSer/pThr/pTyr-binding forkhead associated (FHA) protein
LSKGLRAFLAEAKRRRVFRTAGVYLVAVWGLSQGAIEIAPFFSAPDWIVRALVISGVALLPVVLVLAWMFDIGRSGIVRDPLDVASLEEIDCDIANMSTVIGGEKGQGAVIVRWGDAGTANSAIFTEEFLMGRANDCRVRFYDPLVSRKHARIYHQDGDWRIEDLGSRNGTLVDEVQIDQGVLPGRCQLRLNEVGPLLRIELVPPGAETRSAVASFPPGARIAHVRKSPSGAGRFPESGSREMRRTN